MWIYHARGWMAREYHGYRRTNPPDVQSSEHRCPRFPTGPDHCSPPNSAQRTAATPSRFPPARSLTMRSSPTQRTAWSSLTGLAPPTTSPPPRPQRPDRRRKPHPNRRWRKASYDQSPSRRSATGRWYRQGRPRLRRDRPRGRAGAQPTVRIETVRENVAFASVVDESP